LDAVVRILSVSPRKTFAAFELALI